jgi:hypothetical protein
MRTSLELLANIRVASPCTADWNQMVGDDTVRFCGECAKNVYSLSSMTSDQAAELIREKEGNLCGRFFRRADGTILTADCPIGAQRRTGRRRWLAAFAASLAGLLGITACNRVEHTMGEMCPVDRSGEPGEFEQLPMPREVRDE